MIAGSIEKNSILTFLKKSKMVELLQMALKSFFDYRAINRVASIGFSNSARFWKGFSNYYQSGHGTRWI
jgi:hypothetical protein